MSLFSVPVLTINYVSRGKDMGFPSSESFEGEFQQTNSMSTMTKPLPGGFPSGRAVGGDSKLQREQTQAHLPQQKAKLLRQSFHNNLQAGRWFLFQCNRTWTPNPDTVPRAATSSPQTQPSHQTLLPPFFKSPTLFTLLSAQIHTSAKMGIATFSTDITATHKIKLCSKSMSLPISLTIGFQLVQVPGAGMRNVGGQECVGHPSWL